MNTTPIFILVQAIKISIVFIIIIFFYLGYKRRLQILIQGKMQDYINDKQNMWYEYFFTETPLDPSLIPKDKYEIRGVETVFLSYLKNISNPSLTAKIKGFSNEYLSDHYRTNLHSKKWSIRMNTLYRINDFHLDSLLDELKNMSIGKFSLQERHELLIIYSKFDREAFFSNFDTLSAAFSQYEYKKLFTDLNSDIMKSLMEDSHTLSIDCQCSIIDVLGLKQEKSSMEFLGLKLQHDNPEVRIRSLKAINEIAILDSIENYLDFIESDIWEERLMLAKILGKFPMADSKVYLNKLLKDESWWVRRQAVNTVKSYKNWEEFFDIINLDKVIMAVKEG